MKFTELIKQIKDKHSNDENLITDNGSTLLVNIPQIAPMAYLHSFYSGLNESEIEQLQALIAYPLPKELKSFYMLFNGLRLFGGALSFYGFRPNKVRTIMATLEQPIDIELVNITTFDYHITNSVYIAYYQDDGSIVGYSLENGKIFRQSKSDKVILNSWNSLEEFIQLEYNRLSTLIDDEGCEKAGVTSTTPSISDSKIH